MNTYQQALDALIKQIKIDKVNAIEINIEDIIRLTQFDPTENNDKLKKYLVKEGICTASEWNAAVKRRRIFDKLGCVPTTSREFVNAYVTTRGLTYTKGFIWQQDERYASENFEMEMRLLNDDLNLRYSGQILGDSVNWWCMQRQKEEFEAIKASIFAAPSLSPDELEEMWLRLATRVLDADIEVETELAGKEVIIMGHGQSAAFNAAMLKKGVQQVKQKIKNRPVSNHLMLTLLGPQGIGKTTFLKAFLSPVDGLVAEPNFMDITDNRNIQLWLAYVHLIDEMGYASKAEIDVVKHAISATTMDRRPMFTNRMVRVPQNATFFGGSNKELNELIRDETGLRRFAGCRFRNDADWQVVNDTNYVELWRSVSVDAPDPIEAVRDELVAQQRANRVPSNVELWAADTVLAKQFKADCGHTSSEMFGSYRAWEEDTGLKPLDVVRFGIALSAAIKNGRLPDWRVWKRENVSRYRYVAPTK